GRQSVPRLDREHLVHVLLGADDELEPGAEIAEARDRGRAEPPRLRYPRVGELERDVPLIDGDRGRELRPRGLDLDAEALALKAGDERSEGRGLDLVGSPPVTRASGTRPVRRHRRGRPRIRSASSWNSRSASEPS